MTDVLILDPVEERLDALSHLLEDQGINVASARTIQGQQLDRFDCIIALDELITGELDRFAADVPVIVTTESGTIRAAVAMIQRGAKDYLTLPIEGTDLIAAVERATANANARASASIDDFPMIGSSSAMQLIKEQIGKVAPTDSTVLILGQSGTGKELVARAIHASSQRATAPLVSINCATIPQNLIEPELFGLAQFDGSSSSTHGLVAAADGGTLFLDEVAELPPSAQARLIQVMQGENRKVGSAALQSVNVRIIAATHRDLEQLAQVGDFREDLYYRLNVVTFILPLLRERKDDIMEIAEWLLEHTSRRLNKQGLTLAEDAKAAMLAYHWPGNVRELENAIQRAVILTDNHSHITQALLAIEPRETQDELEMPVDGDQTSLEDYFVRFVNENQDQMTETELAEKLGISRKSLWERRQRLNIPRTKTKRRGPRHGSA